MGFDRTLPPPVFGVSTVPPVARPEGFASQQINWRNDQQDKLTKRPKFRALSVTLPDWTITPDAVESYMSFQNGIRHEVLVGAERTTYKLEVLHRQGYEAFTSVVTDVPATWFTNGLELGVNIIDDKVHIWNKQKVITTTDIGGVDRRYYENVSLVNVLSALNYSEKIEITAHIEFTDGSSFDYTTEYEVPGLSGSNQPAADEARATNTVAAALAKQLADQYEPTPGNPVDTFMYAESKGSNLFVRALNRVGGDAKSLRLELSSGRGDSTIVVMNHKLTSIDGLPKYTYPGVIRTVTPDPTSRDGVYYLEASQTADEPIAGLAECVWTETQDPRERHTLESGSVYFTIPVGGSVITTETFKARAVGDSESNPDRAFIGSAIQQMETFQDRLVILAGSKMNVSKTDDFNQFYLNSALELLVTDPTDVGTSGNSSDLKYAVFHNRDLLIFAEDAQFKVDGQTALTPQTAAMPITTANECDLHAQPVLMGSYVYYANNYGDSAGVRRFEVEADTVVDTSLSITDHIVGYMEGAITKLISNANQTMLICRTSQCLDNQFFVFEQQAYNDQPIYAWSEWRLREGLSIDDIDLFNEVITVRYNGKHYMSCDLKAGDAYPLRDVALDQWGFAIIQNDNSFTLSANYQYNDEDTFTVLIADSQRTDALSELMFTHSTEPDGSHKFTVTEDLSGVTVYYGFKYTALYEPTRPYERDNQGNVRTTDRLRIAHYFLELSNTYRLTRRIISDWWELPDETFTSLDIGNSEYIDDVNPYTGQWRPQIGMNADDCVVQFIEDSPYAATIASIAYRAQQYSTRTRR